MKRIVNGKEIKIPEKEIEVLVKTLKVTEEEAVQIWLEDEGYEINEEQEALCKKAKENRITATVHQAKADGEKKKREYVRKENPIKERLIVVLAAALRNEEGVDGVEITNVGKLIEFKCDGNYYKLDLIQKRVKKA